MAGLHGGCCRATETEFDEAVAERDLDGYRRKGPGGTAGTLLASVASVGAEPRSLLDIGGGIGAIGHELLSDGLERATLVEISGAYLARARVEAERRGTANRIEFVHGDFVELAASLPTADLVTLDRVICCYPDYERLVTRSAARCRRWYGFSLPRPRWYVAGVIALQNAARRLVGNPFRTYVHPIEAIDALLTAAGFERRQIEGTLVWEVRLYERPGGGP